jgi:hypothetical protein
LLVRFVVPAFASDYTIYGVLGAVILGLLIAIWWLFFSRAHWSERLGAIVLMIAAAVATPLILHRSVATGMMGRMFYIYAIPFLAMALVAWAVASRNLAAAGRWASMIAAILLACGGFALVRTDGITGDGVSQFAWRWTPSHEERLLASAREEPVSVPTVPVVAKAPEVHLPEPVVEKTPVSPKAPRAEEKEAEWPGFRGSGRDGIVRGVRLETDWSKSPPAELWRRPVGPAWSSFAVRDDLLFTQEQLGDDEVVACYRLTTGKPVWTHRDRARFWESNGGAGPRGTPALSNGRVYTFGATGIVNALDAGNGAVVWSRNAASDTGAKVPGWGFTSSPLVVGDIVVIAASGRLAAYDLATGNPRWYARTKGGSYSSPHLATIDGVSQVLMLNGSGVTSVSPADGKVLWDHAWPGSTILQPTLAGDGDILITTGDSMGGAGTRRIAVAGGPGGWKVEERWTSKGLKPYFNDLVVHNGHAYGFDGRILSCINLKDGERKWKGGRYGHGQFLLLSDQDLLLVLSEEGELALVKAAPDEFTELARFKAIEGKTWNHPALARDVLLVRNGEEMAAFRLTMAGR